ncbi:MAG: phytanoyl-CoA dioxygenase family protein, partial [Planctomycetes bacterium]|nr:phytanoyl-CoA dioxygenase family protein [Planctomycetota bacterium]
LDRHRASGPVDASFHSSENQHHGDRLAGYGAKAKHYYFHLLTDPSFLSIQHVFHHPAILGAIARILDGPLIINNASLFAAEPRTSYLLPWHRDVIQIPQAEVDQVALFDRDRFHNSVQINLPLVDDETLWVVPGSHHRVDTPAEAAAFAGSKHYAPLDAVMPCALNVRMRPGQAALYNNNLIHRGANPCFRWPRRSLHLGYHGAHRPPTWHFYLLDERRFTQAYRARMTPEVRAMIDAYFACRRAYPRMEDTWREFPASAKAAPSTP